MSLFAGLLGFGAAEEAEEEEEEEEEAEAFDAGGIEVEEEALADSLSGIGLRFSLSADDGLVRVTEIECGGPCWYYVETRLKTGGAGAAPAAVLADQSGMRQVEKGDVLMGIDGTEIARGDGSAVYSAGRSRQEIAQLLIGTTGSTVMCHLGRPVFRAAGGASGGQMMGVVEFEMSVVRGRLRAPNEQTFHLALVGLGLRLMTDFTYEVADITPGGPVAEEGTLAVQDRLWLLNGEYCDQLRVYDVRQLIANPPQEYVGKTKIVALRGISRLTVQLIPISPERQDQAPQLLHSTDLTLQSLGATFRLDQSSHTVSPTLPSPLVPRPSSTVTCVPE